MDGLRNLFFGLDKKEYIKEFCKEYKYPIKTPDGFIVSCKYLEKTAHHFCCGQINEFQIKRAQRVLYAKYILLNPEERTIIENQKTKDNLLFFFSRKRNFYIVICRIVKGRNLDLVSGYPISGKKVLLLQKPHSPYRLYRISQN